MISQSWSNEQWKWIHKYVRSNIGIHSSMTFLFYWLLSIQTTLSNLHANVLQVTTILPRNSNRHLSRIRSWSMRLIDGVLTCTNEDFDRRIFVLAIDPIQQEQSITRKSLSRFLDNLNILLFDWFHSRTNSCHQWRSLGVLAYSQEIQQEIL